MSFESSHHDQMLTITDRARIASYINNLHPQKHRNLYSVIEKVIDCAISLWNMTLSNGLANIVRVEYSGCEYDPHPDDIPDDQRPQQMPGEDDDDFEERTEEWTHDLRARCVVRPEPGTFQSPGLFWVLQPR